MGKTMHKFAVFHYGRSGSTSLCRFFADIGVDIVMDELFHPGLGLYGNRGPDFEMESAMDHVYREHDAVKHNHTTASKSENAAFIDYHRKRRCRIIYLRRTNHLMLAISEAVAKATGIWHAYGQLEQERHASAANGLRIDIEKLHECVQYSRKMDERYSPVLNGGIALPVAYEEIFNKPIETTRRVVARILDFVGWAGGDVSDALQTHLGPDRKMITSSTLSAIANLNEIEKAFSVRLRG